MKNKFVNPNALLLLCIILIVYFVPFLSVLYHRLAYSFLFSSIFILCTFSLNHRNRNSIIAVGILLTIITWVALLIELPEFFVVSKIGQALFFVFIVIQLVRQTATARNVSVRVIADSINGYLLVGIIYAIVVTAIVRFQPEAFHFPEGYMDNRELITSKMFYYTFVTYTSTGYGDITPILPATRSLATLISTTGQLYLAIIIAMLVGKFSSLEPKK